MNKRAVAVICG